MTAYYNENDKYAAQWLRNLIGAGHIAPGVVDDRSILDVAESDLDGFTQCHFFAGIGVWSYALRRAGWPDDRPIWTGSCPCQPFSGAGKREGVADARHLWPVWFRLIRECRPGVILGEQVASKDGLGWWDIVSHDLENEAYAAGAVDTCVPSVGGPHIRQRLYWMANADSSARGQGRPELSGCGGRSDAHERRGLGGNVEPRRLADPGGAGHEARECTQLPGTQRHEEGRAAEQRGCASSGLGDPESNEQREYRQPEKGARPQEPIRGPDIFSNGTSPLNGFWRDADWLHCTDGKWRPVEPGSFPLAHGIAGRVGKLRAYGNAINAEQAIQFIEAARGCIDAR
jgi:DNA (cytosine-5)-methyltransferase 1